MAPLDVPHGKQPAASELATTAPDATDEETVISEDSRLTALHFPDMRSQTSRARLLAELGENLTQDSIRSCTQVSGRLAGLHVSCIPLPCSRLTRYSW